MRLLGAALMILGAVATAAALLAFASPGVREIGFALVAGVTSPRGALIAGIVLLVIGAALRRRATGTKGR
jgi:hypothetical protein